MEGVRGILTAMVTPFDEAGELTFDALPQFLEFQRRHGIDGVVVAGTNGEGVSLAANERMRLLEAVMAQRGSMSVIAGTGACAVTDAVALTRHAGACGADAVLVLPPFFVRAPTAEGLAAYFGAVLDAARVPVLLYHIPQFTAVEITPALVELLAGHPRLAGIKDSEGDWETTQAWIARDGFVTFAGSDPLLSRALAAGAVGGISGTANAFPELVSAVYRAHSDGQDTAPSQRRLDAAIELLAGFPPFAVNKSVLAMRGLPHMCVRPPLVPLATDQEQRLAAALRRADLLPDDAG